ncbi:hypothetical protein KDK_41400 [Dictyobacter kobayashii]|uniref:Uncharacterized protein n=2 Tax=Dictyobacter kobayashii TaxID=2014872 RepID=A0A402AMW8_9CHLR|nr:hypothetical protein KDK_41400 [Dictyobacter kobayashii]
MASGPQKAIPPTPPLFTGPQQAIAQPAENINNIYMPSDLKPITTSLPEQIAGSTQKNPISTSDMSPLPLDNLDLSQVLPKDDEGKGMFWQTPAASPGALAFSPLIAPNIQDDPVLETIMRQAQMGLYALPNPEPSATNNADEDSFLS